MTTSLNLAIIGAILIVSSHGAPTAQPNCTVADTLLMHSCSLRAVDLGEKIKHLHVEDQDAMKEFKRACDALDHCSVTFAHCTSNDDEFAKSFATIKSTCSIINYFADQFKTCEKKLDKKNLTCYEEWNPFQNDKYLSDDTKRDEACKNFFGIGNCFKKEITETCGKEDWEKFRVHFLGLNDKVKLCNFKGIV